MNTKTLLLVGLLVATCFQAFADRQVRVYNGGANPVAIGDFRLKRYTGSTPVFYNNEIIPAGQTVTFNLGSVGSWIVGETIWAWAKVGGIWVAYSSFPWPADGGVADCWVLAAPPACKWFGIARIRNASGRTRTFGLFNNHTLVKQIDVPNGGVGDLHTPSAGVEWAEIASYDVREGELRQVDGSLWETNWQPANGVQIHWEQCQYANPDDDYYKGENPKGGINWDEFDWSTDMKTNRPVDYSDEALWLSNGVRVVDQGLLLSEGLSEIALAVRQNTMSSEVDQAKLRSGLDQINEGLLDGMQGIKDEVKASTNHYGTLRNVGLGVSNEVRNMNENLGAKISAFHHDNTNLLGQLKATNALPSYEGLLDKGTNTAHGQGVWEAMKAPFDNLGSDISVELSSLDGSGVGAPSFEVSMPGYGTIDLNPISHVGTGANILIYYGTMLTVALWMLWQMINIYGDAVKHYGRMQLGGVPNLNVAATFLGTGIEANLVGLIVAFVVPAIFVAMFGAIFASIFLMFGFITSIGSMYGMFRGAFTAHAWYLLTMFFPVQFILSALASVFAGRFTSTTLIAGAITISRFLFGK